MENLACNIGSREQAKRRIVGMVGMAVAVAVAFGAIYLQAPRWSRVLVFVPLWISALGFLQAKEKT